MIPPPGNWKKFTLTGNMVTCSGMSMLYHTHRLSRLFATTTSLPGTHYQKNILDHWKSFWQNFLPGRRNNKSIMGPSNQPVPTWHLRQWCTRIGEIAYREIAICGRFHSAKKGISAGWFFWIKKCASLPTSLFSSHWPLGLLSCRTSSPLE